MRELLLESSPSSPSLPQECTAGLAPPPGSPGFQPAPITAYCGAPPRIIASGDTCASIVKLFALPSVDFLQRINPTLNCSSPKVGLSLCVNKFSQWAIPNCRRFITLWDGDSCQSVISANAATLLYGYDDLMYCNGGLNCNYLLRGMVVCVSCV
ncbi:hypothetical protein PLESTB_000374000 [Pleodorina starrii]|uniref:LysM domain-containing protein n=1 Tax=Pleodorina starrii TaxID=330485 RepID=A0A9W6BF57_9CHLO|nr:hypothetical protein PLESTB_000374000 [Pleodorina starrii]